MYVEFAELRCAVSAYRALNTRWYAGRQLSLQFCFIKSWKNAICGLQLKKRCPKGRACNFLHVFKNPNNLFSSYNTNQNSQRNSRSPSSRSWRWSASPEVDVPKKSRRKHHDISERRHHRSKNREHTHKDHKRRHTSKTRCISSDRDSNRS